MRCLNMKIENVLYFIANFVAVYSTKLPPNKTSQTTSLVGEEILINKFSKSCPQLYNFILENNLKDYTLNCRTLNQENLLNEENVLNYACFIVRSIVTYICMSKNNVSTDFLKQDNASSFCPFDFSRVKKLDVMPLNYKFINELQNPDHCLKVCSDLYSNKTQCVVLNKFNNYLNFFFPILLQKNSAVGIIGEPSAMSDQLGFTQKTEGGVVTTLKDKQQYLKTSSTKEVAKEEKIDAKSSTFTNSENKLMNGEKKTEKPVSSTPKEENRSTKNIEIPETKIKISEDENLILENNELKPKNEDLNEDDEITNEDELTSIGSNHNPFPAKSEFSQEPRLSKLEGSEVKIDSSSKGKEIYSGEGFFQAEDSHFFFYFIMMSSIIIVGYLAFHNKNKILAYALEGTNGRRSRRRPNPARYRKLETNLEEVISSNATNAASSNVVY